MGKLLIMIGADYSKNSIEQSDINPEFDYEGLTLLMNYYFDGTGKKTLQEYSSPEQVYGTLTEDYIPTIGGSTITINTYNMNIVRICEYTATKRFIARQINNEAYSSGKSVFVLDSNTAYIRLSISKDASAPLASYNVLFERFNTTTFLNGKKLAADEYITSPSSN